MSLRRRLVALICPALLVACSTSSVQSPPDAPASLAPIATAPMSELPIAPTAGLSARSTPAPWATASVAPTPSPTVLASASPTASHAEAIVDVVLVSESNGFRLEVAGATLKSYSAAQPWLVELSNGVILLVDLERRRVHRLPASGEDVRAVLQEHGPLAIVFDRPSISLLDRSTGLSEALIGRQASGWFDGLPSELEADYLTGAQVRWLGSEYVLIEPGWRSYGPVFLGDLARRRIHRLSAFGMVAAVAADSRIVVHQDAMTGTLELFTPPFAGAPVTITSLNQQTLSTDHIFSPDGSRLAWFAWQVPDGWDQRYAYQACCPPSGYPEFRQLVVSDLATGQAAQLALPGFEWFAHLPPVWSSDSAALYYNVPDRAGGAMLFKISLDGSAPAQVLQSAEWSSIWAAHQGQDGSLYLAMGNPGTSAASAVKHDPAGAASILCTGLARFCELRPATLVTKWQDQLEVLEEVEIGALQWRVRPPVDTLREPVVNPAQGSSSLYIAVPQWREVRPQAEAWAELRDLLSEAQVLYQPGWLPSRFVDSPVLLFALTDGSSPVKYLVGYRGSNRDLLLLGSGPAPNQPSSPHRDLQAGAIQAKIWRDEGIIASWESHGQSYWLQLIPVGPSVPDAPVDAEVERILRQLVVNAPR